MVSDNGFQHINHMTSRSISSVGLERGANNAKVLGSTPILTMSLIVLLLFARPYLPDSSNSARKVNLSIEIEALRRSKPQP